MLDLSKLAALGQYQAAVSQLKAGAHQDVGAVDQMELMHGGRGAKSRNTVWILIACTSTPVVLGMAFILAGTLMDVPNEMLKGIGSTIIGVGCYVGIGIFFWWYYSGKRRSVRFTSAAQTAICPGCGAPTIFAPGDVLASCKHCGLRAAPNTQHQLQGIAATERLARLARLERYRAERRVVREYTGIGNVSAVLIPWVIGISCGLPLVGGAVWATLATVTGSEPAPFGALIGLWAMVLGASVGVAIYVMKITEYRGRWHWVRSQLQETLGAVSVSGSEAAMNWLDTFWACPFGAERLYTDPIGSSAMALYKGYPLLLIVNPKTEDEGGHVGNLDIVLGAQFPETPEADELPFTPALGALREWLLTFGFTLEAFGGGLHAIASSRQVAATRANPERTLELLPIVEQLAQFALGAGARPMAPMP